MEDSKLQALHDSLSKLRGHQGLGSRGAYSWQKKSASDSENGPADFGLPANALYANFVPAGTYDPKAGHANDGDGRQIKRDFSDINDDSSDDEAAKKRKRKEKRKAEKLEAKKQAKLLAKIKAKKEAKKAKKEKSLQTPS